MNIGFPTCIPDVCSSVILEGPSISPVFNDTSMYGCITGIEENDKSLKELGCIENSSDHGYESDSIGRSTPADYTYTDEIGSTIDDILTDDILVPITTEQFMPQYTTAMSSNDNVYMVPGAENMKMEPPEDSGVWTTFASPAESLIYLQSPTISAPMVSSVCQTTTTTLYPYDIDLMESVKQEPQSQRTYPNQYCYIPNECIESKPDLEISDCEEEDYSPKITQTPATNRRRRKSTKQPILWKFLLDALNNPDKFRNMIFWINKEEGTFQFSSHHKEELSKQWGEAKRNRCIMTYQKMARALRNYINRGEVLRKVKRKLQYTFLPDFYSSISHMIAK